jgi:hypothetical protein
VTFIGGRLNS